LRKKKLLHRDSNIGIFASGIKPLIQKVLHMYMGDEANELAIVANNGTIEGRSWEIHYIDDT
jgi:2-hydroxy-3-keto-5-methylthiopentenyl-1-phosphate phosphatase